MVDVNDLPVVGGVVDLGAIRGQANREDAAVTRMAGMDGEMVEAEGPPLIAAGSDDEDLMLRSHRDTLRKMGYVIQIMEAALEDDPDPYMFIFAAGMVLNDVQAMVSGIVMTEVFHGTEDPGPMEVNNEFVTRLDRLGWRQDDALMGEMRRRAMQVVPDLEDEGDDPLA